MTAPSSAPAGSPEVLDVSILIPAYNEAEGIARVIGEVHAAVSRWAGTSEVIVVDDGSSDRTRELAAALPCRVLVQPVRRGYGAAIKLGLLHGCGRYVAILDADGSYSADDLAKLLQHIPRWDMVSGVRDREWGSWAPARRLVKWLLGFIAQWGTGRPIRDPNSGLKVFRRDVASALASWLPDGFSCSTSLLMGFLACGYSVHYEPIHYRPRVGRSKFRPLRDSWNYLRVVMRFIHAFRPWRLYLPLASAACVVALAVEMLPADLWLLRRMARLALLGLAVAALVVGAWQQRHARRNLQRIRLAVEAAEKSHAHEG
ncbi:MAG: glycosyl transferase [Pirellulaceae bacterium]|nr:MAG: glycosyl transferase [Pirellulaceae bacterium]